MLFNSYGFLFLFLPVVLAGTVFLARFDSRYAAGWLGLASLFFYAWWHAAFLPLLVGSICLNYWMGGMLAGSHATPPGSRRFPLALAVGINLALLGFFKYANFFSVNARAAAHFLGGPWIPVLHVVLPIGISFFTFTQIAFLVDCHQGKVRERDFLRYLLFVAYFPHLIAGPILHHAQMMPQFARRGAFRFDSAAAALGMGIFTIGLCKKTLLADALAPYAAALFGGDGGPVPLHPRFFLAWFGTLAYAFQIYFDFSGYSDMAVGLSLLFGVTLPLNFRSPYRAASLIDFWRRWHISLSTFLRDYVYIPLGGNRRGEGRRYANIVVTMFLGGLWHGANWTFVLWGLVHGGFLCLNHAWEKFRGGDGKGGLGNGLGWAVTFAGVCVAWVLFRAEHVADALRIYKGMFFFNGVSLCSSWKEAFPGFAVSHVVGFRGAWQGMLPGGGSAGEFAFLVAAGFAAVFGLSEDRYPVLLRGRTPFQIWRNNTVIGLFFVYCVLKLGGTSPFLYFQF